MKTKYQNAFFVFGIAVLALMLAQLDFSQAWHGLLHAGYWFVAVVALWAALYVFNTVSWMLIIKSGGKADISWIWLYKITVSGFALNYATPGGLMGGEPYRIMELSPKVGAERASSSVILYVMTHIFSHFCFWLLSVVLYLAIMPLELHSAALLSAMVAFCALGIWFFLSGYRKGLAVRGLKLASHIPWLGKRAAAFIDVHKAQLDEIDAQIAAFSGQNKKTMALTVFIELVCRVCSALEVYFILLVIQPEVDYLRCILIISFTTLFANLLFFLPLQIGGREGGFLMSAVAMGLNASAGAFVALIVRLRELVWTGIGLLLIKARRSGNDVSIKRRQDDK